MPDLQRKSEEKPPKRVAFMARVSWEAYDAIHEIQRLYRRRGEHKPLWKILDAAVRAYAKTKGIKIEN